MAQEINEILDKLTLDSLTLMQRHVRNKLQLEKSMAEGVINIAKARYIMGSKTVSKIQLPTEETPEFEALASVTNDTTGWDLSMEKINETHPNPVRWFGVLVPGALNSAAERFRHSIYSIVECANVQKQLLNVLREISLLSGYNSSQVEIIS